MIDQRKLSFVTKTHPTKRVPAQSQDRLLLEWLTERKSQLPWTKLLSHNTFICDDALHKNDAFGECAESVAPGTG